MKLKTLLICLLCLFSCNLIFAADIVFDISKANVVIDGTNYSGWEKPEDGGEGRPISGTRGTNERYVITGTTGTPSAGGGNHVDLSGNVPITIVLSGAHIYTGTKGAKPELDLGVYSPISTGAITITGGVGVTVLIAEGTTNDLENVSDYASSSYAGIEKNWSSWELVIDSTSKHTHSTGECTEDSCGVLNVVGGADSAGIGGSDLLGGIATNITINGGVINATTRSSQAAGIGSGNNSPAIGIIINGGKIVASSVNNGAGIGGSGGISGDGASGDVTINGGHITAFSQGNGSGIGGGGAESGIGGKGKVVIKGGHVVTYSLGNGASVGGGGSFSKVGGSADVSISNGTVVAETIGGGYSRDYGYNTDTTVTITGGSIDSEISAIAKNADGESVYLAKASLVDTAIPQNSPVWSLSIMDGLQSYAYGIGDLETDSLGNIYAWIPASYNVARAEVGSTTFSGSVKAGMAGIISSSSSSTFFNASVTEIERYYKVYTDSACTERFLGTASFAENTVFDFWVVPESGYSVQAFANGELITPVGGKYSITVTENVDINFSLTYGTDRTQIINLTNGDLLIEKGTNSNSFKITQNDQTIDNITGEFLVTSDSHTIYNKITVDASGTIEVPILVDEFVGNFFDSMIHVKTGSVKIKTENHNDIIASTKNSAIFVEKGAVLTIEIKTGQNLTISGGSRPAIGGKGTVKIIKQNPMSFLSLLSDSTQIEAEYFEYTTEVAAVGAIPYSVSLTDGYSLVGYQSGNKVYRSDSLPAISSSTTYKSLGLKYLLTGVTVTPPAIADGGNADYSIGLSTAATFSATRDNSSLISDTGTSLTIPGNNAYGNISVVANESGSSNKISVSSMSQTGKDGKKQITTDVFIVYTGTGAQAGANTVVLGVELLNGSGENIFFPIENFSISNSNETVFRRKQVFADVTDSSTSTIEFSDVPSGTYKVRVTLYLVPEAAVKSPAIGQVDTKTSETINLL